MESHHKDLTDSPFDSVGFTSKTFFTWMLPFIRQGYGHKLTVDDLSNAPATMMSHSNKELLQRTLVGGSSSSESKKSSFGRASWLLLRRGFVISSVMYFIKFCLLSMVNSIVFWILISSMEGPSRTGYQNYVLAAVLCLSIFCCTFLHHHMYFYAQQKASALRVAACALVYQKVLHMSLSTSSKTTTGQLLNIISADTAKFDQVSGYFMCLVSVPILLVIGIVLLLRLAGPASLAGVGIYVVLAAFQLYQAKLFKRLRSNKSMLTDERLKVTGAVLSSIRIVKFYAWEKPMAKSIISIRKKEQDAMMAINLLRAFNMTLFYTSAKLALFATVMTDYFVYGNGPKAETLFVVFAIFNVIRIALTFDFPGAVERTVDTIVAVRRIQKIFDLEDDCTQDMQKVVSPTIVAEPKCIYLNNAVAAWERDETSFELFAGELRLSSPILVVITGRIGSGKSSFLMNLLREMHLIKGSVDVHGSMSYVSQKPWLFSGTIRQNILFGMDYDESRYTEVIRNCALEQDLESLEWKDSTNVGDKGVTLSGGQKARISLARAVYRDADIYLLDDPLSAVDFRVAQHLIRMCFCGMLASKLILLVTHQVSMLENVGIPLRHIHVENGKAKLQQEEETQILKSSTIINKCESLKLCALKTIKENKSNYLDMSPAMKKEGNVASLGIKGYIDFLRIGNGIFGILVCIGLNILAQMCFVGSDLLVAVWTSQNANVATLLGNVSNDTEIQRDIFGYKMETQDDIMKFYVGISLALFLSSIARAYLFFWLCICSSSVLHNRMLEGLLYTYMSFFDHNPVGRILNRFSKDLETVDDLLPAAYLEVLTQMLMLCGVVVILAFSNPWLLLPVIGLAMFVCFLGVIFFKISRRLKKLEAVARSSVYTHFESSIEGQVTIRALEGASSMLDKEFDRHQDLHSAMYFASFAFLRWFSIWLDVAFNFVIAIITFTLLSVPGTTGSNFGLVLATLFSIGSTIPWVTRLSAELHNQMVSHERILEYVKQTRESGGTNSALLRSNGIYQGLEEKPMKCSGRGRVCFRNVSLKYGETEKPVLRCINFVVGGSEKIGIVGRTGAGKSSLVVALFRLTAAVEGQIYIDGVDTSNMSLEVLRQSIVIIPQDPVLFSTSVRYNLDPFEYHSDTALWDVLESVQLKEHIQKPGKGLELMVIDGGSNFSVGQRQLLCLARALLRTEAKIVVLDEATSSVDNRTDKLIQSIVQKQFATHTIFTIAHRLETVIHMDKIMVIDDGQLVEFDSPKSLMKKKGGIFRKLIEQAGNNVTSLKSAIRNTSYSTKL